MGTPWDRGSLHSGAAYDAGGVVGITEGAQLIDVEPFIRNYAFGTEAKGAIIDNRFHRNDLRDAGNVGGSLRRPDVVAFGLPRAKLVPDLLAGCGRDGHC